MATLVLGALGTLVGGPLGGALGALVGGQVDSAIIGSPAREGPRLKDLAITTSSYGQPIARQHGRMRVAGSIVWATELAERREKSGGGKGRPSVTSYSYSTSFAVALSSRPILGIGRIWADGNLLRGAAGDLKVGGTMRVHLGHGDQAPDPLIAAAQGAACPAFRHCAYVVFEDLQLADFGNRIPALSFEVFADEDGLTLTDLLPSVGIGAGSIAAGSAVPLAGLAGFEHAGGDLRSILGAIDQLYPIVCTDDAGELAFAPAIADAASAALLPEPVVAPAEADDFAGPGGREILRGAAGGTALGGVRYYDPDRDYQPGIQRTEGRGAGGDERTIEFPGALAAPVARALARGAARRTAARVERINWRVAAIDPALQPGATVRVPGRAGAWRITEREWRDGAVELVLERQPVAPSASAPADAGGILPPLDLAGVPTWLHAFEVPWDGTGAPSTRQLFAAVTATGPGWSGAALFADHGGALEPLGPSGRARSVAAITRTVLLPSPAIRLEAQASLEIDLVAADLPLNPASAEQIAGGANRMLVGDEVIQFHAAEPLGGARWRLSGLLRGRGGTEGAAARGHPAGLAAILLDERLIPVDDQGTGANDIVRLAGIGLADADPVYAVVANPGLSRRPLAPVHSRTVPRSDGGITLRWARRARGAWRWADGIDAPLVEEAERYRVGAGPVEQPLRMWETTVPHLALPPLDLADLPPGTPLWVRQIGSHAVSDAALLRAI